MEKGDSVLEAILNEEEEYGEGFDVEDVEMLDAVEEEGEIVDDDQNPRSDPSQPDKNPNPKRNNKKKNKKNRNRNRNRNKSGAAGPGQNVTDINRFVLDTCRRLREKKSYMVYAAVGCLGISAVSDLVKETKKLLVQSCGGQMTADGRRNRTGGGILWNILKVREPMAYGEIMKKTKEFEKQFKQQNAIQAPNRKTGQPHQKALDGSTVGISAGIGAESLIITQDHEKSGLKGERKPKSIHDRVRVPVAYDDLLNDDPKDDQA